MLRTQLFIAGHTVESSAHREIRNPFDNTVVGLAASASKEQVEKAIYSASRAFSSWSKLTVHERKDMLSQAISEVASHRDSDAQLLSREVGKIVHESWVDSLVFELRWNLAMTYAQELERVTELPKGDHSPETHVVHQPLGVVTIIVPFNWPLAILAASLPAALLSGNAVIVKPPASAPLATTEFVTRIAKLLPVGVLNIVSGEDSELSALIQSPKIAKVCFTGSVSGGMKMMQLASTNLTRLTLELGGNDPAIILEDAPLGQEHIDRLFTSVFDTSGQICMNVKRIYVHQSRLDELTQKLVERLEKVVLGDPLNERTTMGPLHQSEKVGHLHDLLADARKSADEVLEFGQLPLTGNFVRPTLVINPSNTCELVQQEQFGPILPIISFEDLDDAIEMANDNWAGLGASVWSADTVKANQVANRLITGYVWINDHGAPRLDLRAPFGGMKHSGFGREQGIAGLLDFTDTRAIQQES